MTTNTTTLAAATTDLERLRDSIRGPVIDPDDEGYDAARAIWNGAIDRRPACIARCTGVADVVAAVRFARDHDLEIAVRGGGHNVAGTAVCDYGVVIDLSAMRAVWVDPAGRTAWVQGGALWGDVDHETQAHGLATTGGIVGHTGVAGLTLGGGIGFLMRKHGLTVDNLLAAEVVTAEGSIVRASADEQPDLFWALRGGGGNFGVVTSFLFSLHPVGPTVMAGPVFWAANDTTDVLRFYRDFAAEAPDELGSVVRLGTVPPLPVIPEDLHWRPAIAVACCYAGAVEDGERAVRALRRFGTPLVDLLAPSPYVAFQGGLDDTVLHGWHYYWKATNLAGLSDDVIAVIADHAYAASSPRSYAAMFHMGGAVARVPRDATAYAGRDVAHNIVIDAVWLPDESGEHAAAESAWARRFLQALQPHRAGGVYVNFLDYDDDPSRVRDAYGDQIYRRLAEVKAKYDPDNAFHHNKNIQPALLDGRYDDAERHLGSAAAVGDRARGDTVRRYTAVQSLLLGRERGGLQALEATIRRGYDDLVDRRTRLAQLAAELGRPDETRAALALVPADAPTLHQDDMQKLTELCSLVAPCALVGDTARAAAVYERLLPHADRIHVRGVAAGRDGSVEHHLGVLAAVLGRPEDAERHFERALERNARLGSPPLLAHTQAAYAELLLARGDRVGAAVLLEPALSVARTLGMAPLEQRAQRLAASAAGTLPAGAGVLRREGDVWAIELDARVVRLRDSRGMRHLARLLGEPGSEVAALELARGPQGAPAPYSGDGLARRTAADDHAGPLLDARAKAEYRARLTELREELEQAERWNDTERAARARAELDAVTDALAAAVGRGGRDRHAAAGVERARMSVSKAIRTAIRNIAAHDPALGEHLAKAVRTGTFCAYAPDARAAIRWTVVD